MLIPKHPLLLSIVICAAIVAAAAAMPHQSSIQQLLLVQPGAATGPKTPVVLVPGDGGSQMEARLDGKPSVPHRWCSKTTKDYFPIWLNLELLTYFTIDCFIDNFLLHFNAATNASSNAPNVSIRVPNYGDTVAVEYFDASRISASAYFSSLVAALLARGYARNATVRGAPFDFRRSPPDLDVDLDGDDGRGFDARLRDLVDATSRLAGDRPVLLLAHSYGNNLVLKFLQRQPADWKRRRVRAYVAVAAPLGGAVKATRLVASGDSLNIPFEKPLTVRPLQRSFGSSYFLLPQPWLWPANEPFASRPGRNYSAADYGQLFADLQFPLGETMRQAALAGYNPAAPPGVEVHCVHGDGLATPGRFVWSSDAAGWADAQPRIVSDNGDGTVNERSLRACVRLWSGAQPQPVRSFVINGAEHVKILHTQAFINYTLALLETFDAEAVAPNAMDDGDLL